MGDAIAKKHLALIYLSAFAVLFLMSAPLFPLNDDWYYSTAPIVHFDIAMLRPGAVFWRPLDVLFGTLVGLCPRAFPAANKFAVVLAHILNAYFLEKILRCLDIKKRVRLFGVMFFLYSPASAAVVFNPDALNQSYCLLFGEIALYTYLKRGDYWYLPFLVVSLFWKESGISWFGVIPLFVLYRDIRHFFGKENWLSQVVKAKWISHVVLCGLTIVVYFVLRFSLMGTLTLGAENGRYAISFFPLSVIKNLFLQIGLSSTCIDSISVFSRHKNFAILFVTLLSSIAFLVLIFRLFLNLLKKGDRLTLLVLIAAIGALAFPQCLLGQVGEMHVYPVLFGVTALFCHIFNSESAIFQNKIAVSVLLCFALSCVLSYSHKFFEIRQYSERTRVLTEELRGYVVNPSEPLLLIVLNDTLEYSVFTQPAIFGADYGRNLRADFGWLPSIPIQHISTTEENVASVYQEHQSEYETILLVDGTNVTKLQ